MILYHYTSYFHLRGIAEYGLTVGDVPTDTQRNRGRVGVWFTSSESPEGHGLGGGADKKRYRLSVDLPDNSPSLVRWIDWAPDNVTPETIRALHSAVAHEGEDGPASWYILFGVVPPEGIIDCVDMETGRPLDGWRTLPPGPFDRPGVPARHRDKWHKKLLKNVAKAVREMAA